MSVYLYKIWTRFSCLFKNYLWLTYLSYNSKNIIKYKHVLWNCSKWIPIRIIPFFFRKYNRNLENNWTIEWLESIPKNNMCHNCCVA